MAGKPKSSSNSNTNTQKKPSSSSDVVHEKNSPKIFEFKERTPNSSETIEKNATQSLQEAEVHLFSMLKFCNNLLLNTELKDMKKCDAQGATYILLSIVLQYKKHKVFTGFQGKNGTPSNLKANFLKHYDNEFLKKLVSEAVRKISIALLKLKGFEIEEFVSEESELKVGDNVEMLTHIDDSTFRIAKGTVATTLDSEEFLIENTQMFVESFDVDLSKPFSRQMLLKIQDKSASPPLIVTPFSKVHRGLSSSQLCSVSKEDTMSSLNKNTEKRRREEDNNEKDCEEANETPIKNKVNDNDEESLQDRGTNDDNKDQQSVVKKKKVIDLAHDDSDEGEMTFRSYKKQKKVIDLEEDWEEWNTFQLYKKEKAKNKLLKEEVQELTSLLAQLNKPLGMMVSLQLQHPELLPSQSVNVTLGSRTEIIPAGMIQQLVSANRTERMKMMSLYLFRKDYLELNNEEKNLLINTIVECTAKTGDNKTVQKYKALYRTIKSKDKKSKNEKEEERDE
ncbi:hypothetical protein C9374_005591 [Naegleria lovaniensis]|uniref:Uncharacterized protein n=1 Tax=Naegleria lovaniensis TaxID=51637 RepID=A0AA88GNN0_NAELO|nr:uncharacterized protein C9374_005591 [Naegleria lovaniensis]KAG2382389.1 hypothetical protein C9374_005591 [Naegleria lovaniensis]